MVGRTSNIAVYYVLQYTVCNMYSSHSLM